jgi:hypothetical protein
MRLKFLFLVIVLILPLVNANLLEGGCQIVEVTDSLDQGVQVNCPEGTVVTGGGWEESIEGEEYDVKESRPSSNGWYCKKENAPSSSKCYAICCNSSYFQTSIENALLSSTNNWRGFAECGSSKILGGGFYDKSTFSNDQDESFPESNGWVCQDYSSSEESECYGICGEPNQCYELECLTESVVGSQNNGQSVYCPSGYTLTGGGFNAEETNDDDQETSKPIDNGWYCMEDNSNSNSVCYARCCKLNYAPITETCNDIDDDCDGEVDEGDLCNSGEVCINGECVSEHQCSSDSQIILRLEKETNAHGEVWDGNYPIEICYDDIFGEEGGGDRTCHGNKVLGLSSDTNAHAEIPGLNNYNPVCYGDLNCQARNSCLGEEECIVSLSSDTNAHLALCDYYDRKICCKIGSISVGEAYWADLGDTPINSAGLKDRVKLIVEGEGFEGKEIEYSIYKDGFWFFDSEVAQSSSQGFVTWRAGENQDGEFSEGNFYFKAVPADGSSEEVQSNILTVGEEDNSPPIALINSPKDKQIYFLGENLNFSQESYDEDDGFSYVWNLGNRKTKEGDSTNFNDYSFLYSYQSTGQKNIKLIVTDDRGLASRDEISILVINSSYVLSYIDYPPHGKDIMKNTVDFDATSSYAVNSTIVDGEKKVECLAGECPDKTEGCPSGSDCEPYPDCCQIPVENTPNWEGFEELEFNWSFDDRSKKSEAGMDGASFRKWFVNPGPHWALLTTSINPSSSTETAFNLYFEDPFCVGGEQWLEGEDYKSSLNDCYREVVAEGSSNTCCPVGQVCEDNVCVESGIYSCGDYETQKECQNYSSNIPKNDLNSSLVESGYYCGQMGFYGDCSERVLCECEWRNETCKAVSEHTICEGDNCYSEDSIPSNIDEICFSDGSKSPGKCIPEIEIVDNCNTTGYRSIKWVSVEWTGEGNKPEYCKAGDKGSFPCISSTVLNFVDIISLVIAILLLILFYINKKKKKKKIRRKSENL